MPMSSRRPGSRFQTLLDSIEAFSERDFAPARLRDELLIRPAGVTLEHCIGAKTRADVLQSASRARDELMIQALVARAAERAGEIRIVERVDVVLRGLQNVGFGAAADIAGNAFEQTIRHAGQV